MLHAAGPEAGGLNVVLHAWATSEMEQGNVGNARVVVAEALRKCPRDQPLYVAAAGVELAGGDPALAREFCLRAYELDRANKHLYLVWPKVMAALGERDKARVLFERGLEYWPRNTKILRAYAEFEAEAGDVEVAADLLERALDIDDASVTGMAVRASLARILLRVGRPEAAQQLLEEGLEGHPDHKEGLLALARAQAMQGALQDAQATLRAAAKATHSFDTDLLAEKAALFRALGERELAVGVEAHLRAVRRWTAAKKAGMPTGQAWEVYLAACREPQARRMASIAAARKRQLGWLAAPGVPGPKAARKARHGAPAVPYVPLASRQPPPGMQPSATASSAGPEEPLSTTHGVGQQASDVPAPTTLPVNGRAGAALVGDEAEWDGTTRAPGGPLQVAGSGAGELDGRDLSYDDRQEEQGGGAWGAGLQRELAQVRIRGQPPPALGDE